MKTLITEKTVRELKDRGEKQLVFDDETMILTPYAKDMLRSCNIKLVYKGFECGNSSSAAVGVSGCCSTSNACNCENEDVAQVVDMIMAVLKEKGLLEQILS